ncbi:MAG: GNAT family N-acetyltransferase [Gemmatimonadota bacterium]|nr:GNAT family N-acetyltransferase [Gemmatimonadota bacterium]
MTTMRPARPDEADSLTELAVRSKSYWGYDAEFLDRARFDLTVSAENAVKGNVFVAENEGAVAGFYSLDDDRDTPELTALFVEPVSMGKGHGRLLFAHAAGEARARGGRVMIIHSDPFAESFYLAQGAVRVGAIPSPVDAARLLPLLHLSLPNE